MKKKIIVKPKKNKEIKYNRDKKSYIIPLLCGIFFSLLIIPVLVFLQSQTWYFLTSTKEQVDFSNLSGIYDTNTIKAYFSGNEIVVPPFINDTYILTKVLGDHDTKEKRLEVDLTNQRIYAIEGDAIVYDFAISSGNPWTPTPTGTFKTWIKLRYTNMKGGSKALGTYYNLPNVQYTMFFANDQIPRWKGYGIHGAYWHNNFGVPMSHGCINMRTEDAGMLYYWASPDLGEKSSISATDDNPGTTVIIYGETPAKS
jgi:hypothetical protein